MSLHERIALELGWTEAMAKTFSLRALRDIVRTAPPSKRRDELVMDIDRVERTGGVLLPPT